MSEIYYKVITKDGYSCVATGKYKKFYGQNGLIVKAVKRTVGLMVFDCRKNAEEFIRDNLGALKSYSIIRVSAVKKSIRQAGYISCQPDELGINTFNKRGILAHVKKPPKGTIFLYSLKVLENLPE